MKRGATALTPVARGYRLAQLRAQGIRLAARELAGRMGVSLATVKRDLRAVRALGAS